MLQRLERRGDGSCEAFLKCGGQLVLKTLEAGETLRFSSGALVAFESSAAYDVQMLSGFKNILFGGKRCWSCSLCPWLSGNHTMTCSFHLVCCTGEGLFITTVTGPGRVMLQALPVDRMLTAIAARVPAGGGGFGLGAAHGGVIGGGGGDVQGKSKEASNVLVSLPTQVLLGKPAVLLHLKLHPTPRSRWKCITQSREAANTRRFQITCFDSSSL